MLSQVLSMALFSISDIIIAVTLIVNAITLMTSKFYYTETDKDRYYNSSKNYNRRSTSSGGNKSKYNSDGKNITSINSSNNYNFRNNEIDDSLSRGSVNNYNINNSRSPNSSPLTIKSMISMKNEDSDDIIHDVVDDDDDDEMDMFYNQDKNHDEHQHKQQHNYQQNLSIMSRIYLLLNTFRRLSGVIVLWNIFFTFLMIFVFRS